MSPFEALRATGLTSALAPVEFGGGGASHDDMGQVLRELGRHDPATAVTLSMHSHLRGRRSGGIATGSTPRRCSNGTVRKVDGGFRASARKGPASGCEVGHVLVTSLRWDDPPDGPQVVHCSVPLSGDGVSIDAAISLAHPADQLHPVWNTVCGAARPLILPAYLGVADSAVELARGAVSGRSEPHVLQLLGEMMNAHTTAADVVAAMYVDSENLPFDNTDAIASRMLSRKTVAAEAVIHTVRLAIEVTGGVGYTRSSDIERLYRDVHGCLFHPLPRAKQTHPHRARRARHEPDRPTPPIS